MPHDHLAAVNPAADVELSVTDQYKLFVVDIAMAMVNLIIIPSLIGVGLFDFLGLDTMYINIIFE